MPASSETLEKMKEKGVQRADLADGECELGYWLHPGWRGRGIMRGAVKALLEWGGSVGVKGVVIRVLEENRGSRGVVEGMSGWRRCEGEDGWVDWPESKGGGRKRLWVWRWEG